MRLKFLAVLVCLVPIPVLPQTGPGVEAKSVSVPTLSPAALETEPIQSSLAAIRERFERPWFPSAILDDAPFLAVLIYADQSRFVMVGEGITFIRNADETFGDVRVSGPAVIWPLLARGVPRFDRLRSVRHGVRVPVDLTVPDLLVVDRGASVVLSAVGVHSRLMRMDFGGVGDPATKDALRRIVGGLF